MKRFDFDKEMTARSAKEASAKFAKALRARGFDWVADEMRESVANGYFCCSNATEHNITKDARPISPRTSDWAYYWGLENIDGDAWYGWFIERT